MQTHNIGKIMEYYWRGLHFVVKCPQFCLFRTFSTFLLLTRAQLRCLGNLYRRLMQGKSYQENLLKVILLHTHIVEFLFYDVQQLASICCSAHELKTKDSHAKILDRIKVTIV